MLRIGIISGKGGVGKTSCTVSLAYAFTNMKKSVGILDADLTGPNVNVAMGIEADLQIDAQRVKYLPVEKDGIKVLSMANILPPDGALMIRGYDSNEKSYTKSSIMKEFVQNTDWGELDILLCDLPPGTGDEAISMIEYLKPDGVIVITTPHSFAYADYLRVMHMLELYSIRVFKTVINMAYALLPCPHPDICKEENRVHRYDIFKDGDFQYENAYEIPLWPEYSQSHIIELKELADEILEKFVVA